MSRSEKLPQPQTKPQGPSSHPWEWALWETRQTVDCSPRCSLPECVGGCQQTIHLSLTTVTIFTFKIKRTTLRRILRKLSSPRKHTAAGSRGESRRRRHGGDAAAAVSQRHGSGFRGGKPTSRAQWLNVQTHAGRALAWARRLREDVSENCLMC